MVSVRPARDHYDKARFYTIDGREFPSVTTILDILEKPGLMWCREVYYACAS